MFFSFSGNKRISSKVERFNPLCNQWETRRPLSVPRFFGLLASVGNKLFLLGGATVDSAGNVVCVDKVECYTPLTDTWTTVASMAEPRAEAGLAVMDKRLYIVGGYSWNTNKRLKSVEYYDIDRDKWHKTEDIETPYTGVGCCSLMLYRIPESGLTDPESELDSAMSASVESTTDESYAYMEGHDVFGDGRRFDSVTSYIVSKAPSMPY